jgi:archaellum component FlaF (FlaF/FlaG flagellin family)
MKKIIFIAVFTVSGLVFVSCSTDTEGLENASQNKKELVSPKQNDGLFSREGDTIPMTNTTMEGPGDDVIPIKPPKA